MADFANLQRMSGLTADQAKRIGRRDIVPASVRKSQLPQDLLANTDTTVLTTNVGNGVTITITSRSSSEIDPDIRLGLCPFMITFYEAASLGAISPGTNQIPHDVATGRYSVYGPIAMPDYTVNGKRFQQVSSASGLKIYFASDGNDVVYKTSIANNSGSAQDIVILIQERVIQSRGGGSGS